MSILEPLFLPLDGYEVQQSLPASLLCCGQCTNPILYQAKENLPTAKGVNMVNSTEGVSPYLGERNEQQGRQKLG